MSIQHVLGIVLLSFACFGLGAQPIEAKKRNKKKTKSSKSKKTKKRKKKSGRLTKEERKQARKKLLAYLQSKGVPPKGPHRRINGALYGFPRRYGPFPVMSGIASRAHYWSDVFSRFPRDHVLIYNHIYYFVITAIRVPGAALNPGEPKALRIRKARKRINTGKRNIGRVRRALGVLVRREVKAERIERAYWSKKQGLCKALKTETLRILCRRELAYRAERVDRKRWAKQFQGIKNKLSQRIYNIVMANPFAKGPKWHRIFRTALYGPMSVRSSYRGFYSVGLKIEQRFRPHIQRVLKKSKLPKELSALPFVESMYNPWIRSSVGALGLWQLMPNTAKENGLYIIDTKNRYKTLDERLDPVYATYGATNFIKLCRHFFPRNWPLAITSYNQGPGRVISKAKRAGGRSLVRMIRRYKQIELGPDGRNFYSKLLASIYVIKNVKKLFPKMKVEPPLRYGVLRLHRKTNFKTIAKISGLSAQTIVKYNPAFRAQRGYVRRNIPPYYPLRFPKGKFANIKKKMEEYVYKRRRSTTLYRTQRDGETLDSIAKKYNMTLEQLHKRNRRPFYVKKKKGKQALCYGSSSPKQQIIKQVKGKKATYCKAPKGNKALKKRTAVWVSVAPRRPYSFRIRSIVVNSETPMSYIACKACTTIWHIRHLNPKMSIRRLKKGTAVRVPSCPAWRRRSFRNCKRHHFIRSESSKKKENKKDDKKKPKKGNPTKKKSSKK